MHSRPQILMRPPGERYPECVVRDERKDPIDLSLARRQHLELSKKLQQAGAYVKLLRPLSQFPDSVFIEDAALVVAGRVLICPFAVPSRAGEEIALAKELGRSRDVEFFESPAVIDGGDCIVTEEQLFVGISNRTNCSAYEQLAKKFTNCDVRPIKVDTERILHLKTGATYVGDNTMVVAPHLVDPVNFPGFRIVEVSPEEEVAANCLRLMSNVFIPSGCPNTAEKLARIGFDPVAVDLSEFVKGDGSLTCLCLEV